MSRKFFSLSEELYFKNYQPKIEIENCPVDHQECLANLPFINQCFYDSQQSFLNKDYECAVNELKRAFDSTFTHNEACCNACISLFRSTILDSLEALETDLKKMTSGRFKARHQNTNLQLATQTLELCKSRI